MCCLCETDDIFDDDIKYFFKTVENAQFHKVSKYLHAEKIY